tara:strand:- start:780 stop:1295 length:516 start_codon:yes stop_codon:yes gene_type:complete
MRGVEIITIPVYRIERGKYNKQKDLFSEKVMFGGPDGKFKRAYAKSDRNWYFNFKYHLDEKFGGSWEYNEIIGYLEIYILGNQVRAQYWQDNKKRIVKTRKKQFVFKTHKLVPEVSFDRSLTNEDIFDVINECISDCKQELKGRYLDTSTLDRLGPYINWKELIKNENLHN